MPSLPLLRALGLNFSPNQLEVAPGSLVEASNVIIRRDNVIESRRGYALYGTAMGSSSDRCKQLLTYKNKLLRHFSNRLQYENGLNNAGTTSFFDFKEAIGSLDASVVEAQSGLRIKSIEANSNLYLTTSEGIKKISAKSSESFAAARVTKAGGVKALDVEAALKTSIGNQSGFLPSDGGVSYKVVWGTKDANGNLVLGAPSSAATVLNPLLDLTLRDFSNFLLQLDSTANSNPSNSLISETDYYSSLALPITADAADLRAGLIAVAKKLDEDLLYATDSGTGLSYGQLKIAPTVAATAATTSGLTTITLSAPASNILEGMTAVGIGINGTVLSVSGTSITLSSACTITQSSTPVTFYGISATGGIITTEFLNTLSVTASNSAGDLLFTSGSAHGFKAGMPVQFYASSYPGNIASTSTTYYIVSSGLTSTTFKVSATANGTPVLWSSAGTGVTVGLASGAYFISADNIKLSGFKSNNISIDSLNSTHVISSVNPNRISFTPSNYSETNPLGISGTITQIPTTKASDTGTIVLSCSDHGLKDNQKIAVSGSNSVPSIDAPEYTITYLSTDSFSVDLKKSFSTPNFGGTVAVSFQNTGDTVTYNSHGLLAGDSVVFTLITPATPAPPPFGIVINTRYYVVNSTTNTFQVASSPGGSPIALTADGTGTMARAPTQYITSANHGYVAGDTVSFNITSALSEAVTFTDATDTVTLTAATPNLPHGFNNGDIVQFTSITPTTGISINTKYYVVNVNSTGTTFQLSATQGGAVLPLTTNGTGVMQRLSSSQTYYVISNGLTQNTFQVSSSLNGSANTVTGTGTVTKQITSSGSSASWNVIIDGVSSVKIESNAFRAITEPEEPSSPFTNNDAVAIRDYYSNILSELQNLIGVHGDTIVDNLVYSAYLSELDVTDSASTVLKFTIPSAISAYSATENPYFYQIYRTDIATVSGVTSIANIAIIPEFRQIEEAFPTQQQLNDGIVEFIDETPESIAGTGANLYTNERSGEGALQANDIPPFATDINSFKGHTFFSNTKTKQRKNITLIGVANMVSNYQQLGPYKLTIGNGTSSQTYEFVTGIKQVTELVCNSAAGLAISGQGNYFLINSANDETEYYVWYKALIFENVSFQDSGDTVTLASHGLSANDRVVFDSIVTTTGISTDVVYYVINPTLNTFQLSLTPSGSALPLTTDGTGVMTRFCDPQPVGKTGIAVVFNPSDASTIVAQKTVNAINNILSDFTASVNPSGSSTVVITNQLEGESTPATLGTLPAGFSISTTTTGRGEKNSLSGNQVLISSSESVGIAIEETAKSLIRVINRNSAEILNAFYVSGTTTAPGAIFLESKSLNDDEFYLLGGDSIIGDSFNPSLSPSANAITAISIANPTLITAPSHGLLNGDRIIISASNSTPSINGVYQITVNQTDPTNQFTIPVNVTASGSGAAVFKSLNDAEGSSNEEQPHRVYYSKFQQPESVPLLNYLDVGATDKAVLRIFPLRDSLFVFKQDGLYRISGEVAPFSVALFDSSCILIAPDSVAVSNNQIYGWTTQGISTVTEAGVSVISRSIDTEILRKASSQFTDFKTATWGVGYESDNSYTVYTTAEPTDTRATIGFRYSNLTNSWTTVDKSVTAGILNPADDKLYLGAGDTNYLEKERKEFTRYDYADRELSFQIVSSALSGSSIAFGSVSGLSVGDVVVQDQTLTVYEFNLLLQKLDGDPGVPSSNYLSMLAAQAGDDMRAKLEALATKLDSELTFGYANAIASLTGSIGNATIANPTVITTTAAHGLQSGRKITISGNSSPEVNGDFEVTVTGLSTFTIPVDLLIAGSGGSFITIDENFEDLKTCYNLIISRLNADPIVSYSNYRSIDNNTIQEAIISSIDLINKTITLNISLEYVVGAITIYKAIPCRFTYSPLTMDDPLGLKHIRESTMMFANKAFTSAKMEFSTDLLPEIIQIPFNGDGNGIFGHQPFGSGFFGGGSNAAPFRTFVPRQCQRCRYINVGFEHKTAREQYAIYGITLTGEIGQSTRAYR